VNYVDLTKLIVVFRDFAKANENYFFGLTAYLTDNTVYLILYRRHSIRGVTHSVIQGHYIELLFYVTIIGCYFLSPRLSYFGPHNRLPT